MLQLAPSLPVETQFGYGDAVGWAWPHTEHSLYWIVLLHESRQSRVIPNEEVRACTNWTLGRRGFTQAANAVAEVKPWGETRTWQCGKCQQIIAVGTVHRC